jgi:5-methyltetrahydrofolate--homocysteine methyltransferase
MLKPMDPYSELQECVIIGQRDKVVELTQGLIDSGAPAKEVLQKGLIPGMSVVGQRFKDGEYFIPEMLMAARALNAGLDLLKPLLESSDFEPVAKVVMGTVKGDIHDIGKNLVAIMLRGGGFEVIDAGVDVSPDKFIELVREHDAHIVGLSALLTTTMPSMKDTIEAFVAAGARDDVKIMIGGAPVSEDYAKQIGADGFARNSSAAVDVARRLVGAET